MTANEAMKEALELLGIDNAVEEPLNEEERRAILLAKRKHLLGGELKFCSPSNVIVEVF